MASREALVVVGTGMAGAKLVEEIHTANPDRFSIRMFGAEPHGTYNRILLSTVLGGFSDPNLLWINPLEWYEKRGVHVHAGVKADVIDRGRRVVVGGGGKVEEPYDVLVMATGSRPFVPPMEGTKQQGVFVFRTLDDCATIGAYAEDCDRAVVIGGGLLGLEAARGLLSHGLEVTVVEVAPAPDDPAARPGRQRLAQAQARSDGRAGLAGHGDHGTARRGSRHRAALPGRDRRWTPTWWSSVAASAPTWMKRRQAGLAVDKAIVVDDQLRTSDPAIFAVGECAQHRGKLYGLVDPLYEQAGVLADVVTGAKPDAAYQGSRLATTLKVMGDRPARPWATSAAPARTRSRQPSRCRRRAIYKKLVIRDNRLVGAVLLGVTDPAGRLLPPVQGKPAARPRLPSICSRANRHAIACSARAGSRSGRAGGRHADLQLQHRVQGQNRRRHQGRQVHDRRARRVHARRHRLRHLPAPAHSAHRRLRAGHTRKEQELNKIELMKQEKDGLDALDGRSSVSPRTTTGRR